MKKCSKNELVGEVMDNIRFRILKYINEERNLTQRSISKAIGMSLGKVNTILGSLKEDGYIEIRKKEKGHIYSLTNDGINKLEGSLISKKNIKLNITHVKEEKIIKKAVILAAAEKKEFDRPVCFMELGSNLIIDRTIEILRNLGVEKFILVTGYKKEYFNKYIGLTNFTILENKKYKWTGSMHSLMEVNGYIDDDFILIEDDLIIEESALQKLIQSQDRDCLLITNENGRGREAFVQIKDEHVFKLSKDINMFNRIDGEMVGALKISIDLYKKMLKEMETNINQYINYEYILMDISRNYNIGYLKVDDIVWSDVDELKDYDKLIKRVYPLILRKEQEVKINNIKKYLIDIMKIEEHEISEISIIGGMTNRNYKVSISGDHYVLRIAGNGTEEMINRTQEKNNSEIVTRLGIDAELVFCDVDKGIKISKYIKDASTLTNMTAKKKENMELVTKILKKLHESDLMMDNEFNPFNMILKYEEIVNKNKGLFYDGYNYIKDEIMKLIDYVRNKQIKLCPCHNDTLPDNFIKSGEKMYLIDWEYAGVNDPMWDLAAHCLEAEFNENEEELFINLYFGYNPGDEFKDRIIINKILQDFLWSIWTIIKESQGDSFGTYGIDRFNRAKENLRLYKGRIEK